MYYRDLFTGHKAFWKIERRANHYDIYMRELKNWEKWPDSVSIDEIEKLLQFIPKWNGHFRYKNPTRFAEIFKQILPTIREFKDEKLTSLNPEFLIISNAFSRILSTLFSRIGR